MTHALAEKLRRTGPAEKSGFSVTKRAVGKYTRAVFAKRNRTVCPKHQIERRERIKASESRTLAREEGSEREHEEERVDSSVKEGRQNPRRTGRASKKSLPRGSRRKHEWVSGRKSSPGASAEFWFHSRSSQT